MLGVASQASQVRLEPGYVRQARVSIHASAWGTRPRTPAVPAAGSPSGPDPVRLRTARWRVELEPAGGPKFPGSARQAEEDGVRLGLGHAVRDQDRHLAELAHPPELLRPRVTGNVEVTQTYRFDAGEGQTRAGPCTSSGFMVAVEDQVAHRATGSPWRTHPAVQSGGGGRGSTAPRKRGLSAVPRFAVIGDPVAHSASPRLFRWLADRLDLGLGYEPLRVPARALASVLEEARAGRWDGCR